MSMSEPMELFLYAMKSDTTKDRYTRRLGNFFDFLEYGGTTAEQSKQFISNAQKNGNSWVTASVMRFLSFHKERVERGEIAAGTIRNYYKPIKLFLEMNDIELSWRKITRGLPIGRKHAADRAPTVSEIQQLIEYPDRRIKAIVFTMLSSGIRLGAWDYLRWSHITLTIQEDNVVAAKITVYAGDSEEYFSFITPEAYAELKKWIDFREKAGEKNHWQFLANEGLVECGEICKRSGYNSKTTQIIRTQKLDGANTHCPRSKEKSPARSKETRVSGSSWTKKVLQDAFRAINETNQCGIAYGSLYWNF